jgi:hypothetical protein
MRAHRAGRGGALFYHALMLRELYSRTTLASLLSWRLYEPADFDQRAVSTYLRCYSWLGACAPLALPHALLMLLLRAIPGRWYARGFELIGMGHLLARYEALKRELGMFDGIKRGI